MQINFPFSTQELYDFIIEADLNTYAGDAEPVKNPLVPDFNELVYSKEDFSYRDSYTGHYKSRGMTVVRYRDKPVWCVMYGGGMTEGNNELSDETFNFLKKALSNPETNFQSFRGPLNLKDADWEYKYVQEGNTLEFNGYEEIFYKGKLVFFHKVIGGVVEN